MELQLTLINDSGKPGNLIAFQRYGQERHSLAWLSKYAYPGTQVAYTWDTDDLAYIWAGTGKLGPDVVVDIAQIVPASTTDANNVAFSYDADHRTFFFHAPTGDGPAGQLIIRQDHTVPVNAASVGIAIAGKATIAFDAQPNLTISILPHASLYVAFGDFKQGQYIGDVEAIGAVEVKFPANVIAMTATIDADGNWTVEQNVLGKKAPEEA